MVDFCAYECLVHNEEILLSQLAISANPGGSVVKNLFSNAGDVGSISGLGRSAGEGNGNPLQYSCQENPMGRGAW